MAHLQYMPGDPRLVDQLVCELKSKGIFDQFRKECISDVDTRPAYQNLRQRVESSVTTFLARQCWKPDLNKNQLREKLRKHILDGNYLEQGVERIVDQVVNPKVASVFIPQVEDLVYNYFGIARKKTAVEEPERTLDLLPTDLEAVSPGSVRSNDDKEDVSMDGSNMAKQDIDTEKSKVIIEIIDDKKDYMTSKTEILSSESDISMDKSNIPLPSEIKLENIPEPENSPPKAGVVELEKIALPKEPVPSTDIPLPEETIQKGSNFKPILLHSEESNSSSDSSLRRNMSPLTPIRNYNNENSYDAQQAFETNAKLNEQKPSSFRFTIESEDSSDSRKKDPEPTEYQFHDTPLYDDSSNSNNLRIDYESDANSKAMVDAKTEAENTDDRKEKKVDKKNQKSSHRSRDSHRHSSSKRKRSDSKHSNSRDGSKHEKKSSSKDDHKKSSKDSRERSKDRGGKKDNREPSKHKSSKTSSHKDSKSYRSSSHRHSGKTSDDKKISSSSNREKEKESKDKSKDRSKDSRSSSHRSEKDRKSSSSSKKSDEKDKKKDKKDVDDHYSHSGRGNHGRRSTDRDSNDGSSFSKGSHNQSGSKGSDKKGCSKSSSSKSDNTSTTSGETPSPSDKDQKLQADQLSQFKPAVRVDNHLETPIANPPRLPFVPDITLKKPKFAANLAEARQMMKMRKFLDEEQKRMNQEAVLLLEFQANVRPSLSQVYSSIPGPELEFACGANTIVPPQTIIETVNENLDNSDESDNKDVIQPEPHSVQQIFDIIIGNPSEIEISDQKNIETYDENKPFSKLVEEISEYSKASENKAKLEKINDKQEYRKGKNNVNNSAEYFKVDITTEKLSESKDETDIEEKIETNNDESFEELESPPYEDITANPDVTQNQTDITNLQQNNIGDEENNKEFSVEKDPLKIERIEEHTEIPEIDKNIKSIVKDDPSITEDSIELEESIENIKECIEKETIELNSRGKHIKSDQSFNYLDSGDTAINEISEILTNDTDKISNIPEIESTYANKEKKVPEIALQKTQENQTPDTVQDDNQTKNYSEIVPLIANEGKEIPEDILTNVYKEQKVSEIIELNTSNENKVAEKVAKDTSKNIPEMTVLHGNEEMKNPVIVPHDDEKYLKMILQSPGNDPKSKGPLTKMPKIEIQDKLKVHEFLKYFTNEEKLTAQSETDKFSNFFQSYTEFTSKIYLINCDTYEENIIKEVAKCYGNFEIVNYFKNGHSKVPNKSKNIVKDIRLSQEVTLPTKTIFSPTKSECSFELCSDYDAKLDEIVNKKSRQEVMEIILGSGADDSSKTSKESRSSNVTGEEKNMKRKMEVESSDGDKRSVLTPTKLRKLSDSDQISSTTEETEEITSNNNKVQIATRSKYLGRAKRVGLSKPKRYNQVNSPSSDKSVENYVQNTPPAPLNGKIKPTPRSKVQRYDTSDLYKPKLHYLSRRNNIT